MTGKPEPDKAAPPGPLALKMLEASRDDELLGCVLRTYRAEIPPAELRWLKAFLRAHLSRPEYRLLMKRFTLLDREP